MSSINYKPLIEEKIEVFKTQNPEYTYGQIIYSALAVAKVCATKVQLLELSDEDFYTYLEEALMKERED